MSQTSACTCVCVWAAELLGREEAEVARHKDLNGDFFVFVDQRMLQARAGSMCAGHKSNMKMFRNL